MSHRSQLRGRRALAESDEDRPAALPLDRARGKEKAWPQAVWILPRCDSRADGARSPDRPARERSAPPLRLRAIRSVCAGVLTVPIHAT